MLDTTALWGFVALALAGSLHCAGMCGPFALAVGWRRDGSPASLAKLAAYIVGKSVAYVLLAAALMLGADALSANLPSDRAQALATSRSALAWLAGGVMVLAGLHSLGAPGLRSARLTSALQRPFSAGMRTARALPPLTSAFAVGLLNGCLPCGLSWSAVLFAASVGGATAIVGPFLFGLATSPALAALAVGGAVLSPSWRRRLRPVAALALVGFGLWTVWRGGLPIGPEGAKSFPPCCPQADAG